MLIQQLKSRCANSRVKVEERNSQTGTRYVELIFHAGREERTQSFHRIEGIQELLEQPFESYGYVGPYSAIWSHKLGTIEAVLRPKSSIFGPMHLLARMAGRSDPDAPNPRLELQSSEGPVTASIGRCSDLMRLMDRSSIVRRDPDRRPLSLTLNGLTVGQHDHALEILEKISNSLFFQIDLTHNVLFSLAPERLSVRSTRTTPKQRTSIEFPRTEFDKAPLSLYFYGRNADGMPLLRFLAYYQVIEFYFPVYSRAEAQRRVREIIKSPAFRADRDTDVARILAATRTATHAGDERAQLRATINECVDPATLREFFAESARKEFFALRGKKALTKRAIIVKEGDGESADLRSDVAERIYEIRCKIVHTKGQAGDPDLELLLPYSAEAQMLQHDIDLVQLVARSVLISASTAMTLATPSGNQE